MKKLNKEMSKTYVIIVIIAMITSFFIYQLSISDTVKLYQEYVSLKAKESELSNVHNKIAQLKSEKHVIESHLGYGSTTATINLLKELSDYCTTNNITLKSIPPMNEHDEDGIYYQHQSFVVEGSFISILKLIQSLETQNDIGRIVSVNFSAEEDRKSKRRRLYATCVVQNILINHNEA